MYVFIYLFIDSFDGDLLGNNNNLINSNCHISVAPRG